MQKRFPEFSHDWTRGRVIWRGVIRPTPMSDQYHVRVRYRLGKSPRIWVVEPRLEKRPGSKRIPHTYARDRLCLYLPRAQEWTPSMPIADTIIPWTHLWLFHYEIWWATGEWHGGGVHPTPKNN